jgi:uncharacterized protein (DUF983 family)
LKRATVLLFRALRLRCPACAGGPLFTSWLTMRSACPGCGLVLEREEGYWTGAIAANLIVTELLMAAGVLVSLLATWPTPPWTLITIVWGIFTVVFPFAFFPFSRMIWLAFDLFFRPIERKELRRQRQRLPR